MLKPIMISAALALALMPPAAAQDVSQPTDTAATETTVAAAGGVPQAVIDACKGDFEKHCSSHAPESTSARDCMAESFGKLSDPCVSAILDSPLVEQEQQRLADAQASEQSATEGAKATAARPATRTAKARHAAASKNAARKYSSSKNSRRVAQYRHKGPRRSVTAHIRRGTGIASRYVKKYTRLAFARVFR